MYIYSPPPLPTNSFDSQNRYTLDPFNFASRISSESLTSQSQIQQFPTSRSTLFNADFSSKFKSRLPQESSDFLTLNEPLQPKFALTKSSKLLNSLSTSKPSIEHTKPVLKPPEFTFTSNFDKSAASSVSNAKQMSFSFKPATNSILQSINTVKTPTPLFETTLKMNATDLKKNFLNNSQSNNSKNALSFPIIKTPLQETSKLPTFESLKSSSNFSKAYFNENLSKDTLTITSTTSKEPITHCKNKSPLRKVISHLDANEFINEALEEIQNLAVFSQLEHILQKALNNEKKGILNRLETIRQNLFLLW